MAGPWEEFQQEESGPWSDFSAVNADEGAPAAEGTSETKAPWFEAGPVRIEKSPLDVNWLSAAANEVTKPTPAGAMTVADNPLLMYGSPASNAVASTIGSRLARGAESFATSPVPKAISDSTNVVKAGRGIINKMMPQLEKLSPNSKRIADFISGAVGRKAAYSNPMTAVPQGVSDAAKGVQFAQKGIAKVLDSPTAMKGAETGARAIFGAVGAKKTYDAMPSKPTETPVQDGMVKKLAGTKYEKMLADAKSRGDEAYKTTQYLLATSDPEFQELMKEQK